jgi:hypothetical protein
VNTKYALDKTMPTFNATDGSILTNISAGCYNLHFSVSKIFGLAQCIPEFLLKSPLSYNLLTKPHNQYVVIIKLF